MISLDVILFYLFGGAEVARSSADGHTLLFTSDSSITSNPHLFKKASFDPIKELAPVTQIIDLHQMVVVHPSAPIGRDFGKFPRSRRNCHRVVRRIWCGSVEDLPAVVGDHQPCVEEAHERRSLLARQVLAPGGARSVSARRAVYVGLGPAAVAARG